MSKDKWTKPRWRQRWLLACLGALLGLQSPAFAQADDIRLLAPAYSDQTEPYLRAAADAFAADHPDTAISVEVVDWDELFARLAAESDAPPDIAIVATRWLVDLAAEGAIAPLDAAIAPELASRFMPSVLAASTMNGQLWGLPFAASSRALYVNQALLQAAGHTNPPATWTELATVAGDIAALGDETYGFGIQGKGIETDIYFGYALWSHGGEIVGADGRVALDSDAARAAATLYSGMIAAGATQPDVAGSNRATLQDMFVAGDLGMVITGPWLASRLAQEAPTLDVVVAPVPAGTETTSYGVTDSVVLMAGATENPDAIAFLDVLFSPEWRVEFLETEGFVPVTTAVADSEAVTADPVMGPFARTLAQARFEPLVPEWEEIADIATNALRRIYLGDADPGEALARAAAEIESFLVSQTPSR